MLNDPQQRHKSEILMQVRLEKRILRLQRKPTLHLGIVRTMPGVQDLPRFMLWVNLNIRGVYFGAVYYHATFPSDSDAGWSGSITYIYTLTIEFFPSTSVRY